MKTAHLTTTQMAAEAWASTSSTNSKLTTGGPDKDGSSDGHAIGEGHEPDNGMDDGGPDDYGSSDGIKSGIGKLDNSLEGVSDGFADDIGRGDGRSAFPFGYGSRTGDPQAGTRTVE